MWCIAPTFVLFFWAASDCTTAVPAASGATFCQVARPIYWHAADTRQTKVQIDILNRKWKRLCGRKG